MTFSESIWTHLSFTLVLTSATLVGLRLVGWMVTSLRLPRLSLLPTEGQEALPTRYRHGVIALFFLASGLSIVRADEVDFSGHLLAYTGELSFATLFVLSLFVYSNFAGVRYFFDKGELRAFHSCLVFCGLALYLTTLSGRGPDLYALGYEESLAWVGLAISAVAVYLQRWLVASLLLGAIVSWHLRLGGSVNLFDYAVDPFIFAGAAVQSLAGLLGSFLRGGTKRVEGLKLERYSEPLVTNAA